MRVLGENVLIRQVLKKKVSLVITGSKENDENVYESELELLELGPDVKENFKKGEKPVIANWAEPVAIKVIKGKTGDAEIIRELVYRVGDIVALD
mgnify:CR=1 FL=1